MQIRRPAPDELVAKVFPLRWYAFEPSPPEPGRVAESERFVRYTAADHTLVAEEGDQVLAVATGISMRQNLRGTVHPMAGVAGVASHPLARRRGHVRALLNRLLGEMRDSGHPLSALYPFRPSFYQRFGYVGLPAERTASFAPADLRPFLDADLDGELHWERIGTGHEAFRTFTGQLLARRHGFAVHPAHRATLPGDLDQSWLVTARVAGEVVAATSYRIADHGGDLVTDGLLHVDPAARALLLRFFAGHVDQVTRIRVTVSPDERPELWATDLAAHVETRIVFPGSSAPMARLLSMDALRGLPAGTGRVVVEVVDDPYVGGWWLLDADGGRLDVTRLPDGGRTGITGSGGGTPVATLTAAGLSGLAYGVLDPVDVVVRGLGSVPAEAAGRLRAIFPPLTPYLHAHF